MPKIVDVDQRRLELASAAARVIACEGIAGATMREVAAEAGWTTGALLHYFANKRELLQFTLGASLDERRSRRAGRASLGPHEALRLALSSALPLDEVARLHWIVTVAFAAQATTDAGLAEIQRDAYREFRDHLTELLDETDHGASSPDALRVEAERLIALVDGTALQALFDPDGWPPERQLAALDAGMARWP
jgi:AcrR family transcriptional regulator